MYLKRSIEWRSCNYRCSGKAINIKNSGWVFVALGTQLVMRIDRAAICGLSGSKVFFHTIS
jgi:hypothetical protein